MAISYARRVKPKHVRLAGIDLLPRGPVQFEMTNMHGRKVAMGDTGPDSHPTNSTITQRSWAGGGQIKMANPDSDMQRFDWSTLMTEYDRYLTLPFETFTYGPADKVFSMCWGDYPAGDNGVFHAQIEDILYKYDPVTGITAVGSSLGSFRARNAGVVYRIPEDADTGPGTSRLFVPGGSTGMGELNASTFTAHTGANVIDLTVWDEKLFMLTGDGKVWHSIDPLGVHPLGWTEVGVITDGSSPRRLINYVNRADAETLYVVTSSAVWGLDFPNARLVKTYFAYPRHPRQGWGAAHWRAELWTSVGMGAHRYDLSQVIPSGIDRDQGVPPDYRGYVSDIVGSYNDLFMYIRGSQIDVTPITEEETLDVGGGDETMYADSALTKTNNLVMAWNGIGYHYRWAGPGKNPGNMYVSQADNAYNLWWCNDGKLLRQHIPFDYFNPGDPQTASSGRTFAPSGFLNTPWYDWNWAGQIKLLKRLEFGVKWASPTEWIDVYYMINNEELNTWIRVPNPTDPAAPTITSPGRIAVNLGIDPTNQTMPDGVSPRYIGVAHNRFKLRFEFHRGADATKRPVIDWWSAIGRRVLNPIRTWRFNIDMTHQNMGGYPASTSDFLQGLALKPEAVQFDIWDESYMVEVVALAGPKDATGQEFAGFMTIHLLESNDLEIPTQSLVSLNGTGP